MNLTSAMISTFLRRALSVAAAGGALLATSCNTFPPPTPVSGPPFAPDGRPRYGHNGTESPTYATEPRALPGSNQGLTEIKRDPRDTTVNINPPDARRPTGTNIETPNTNLNSPAVPPVEPTPAPTVKPREELMYGIPVVGKKGMVYSPHAPEKGQVDVEGLKRGTRVKCPYTGMDFRVP